MDNTTLSKSERVLNFIADAGMEGRKFTEIQEFVCKMNGLDWNKRDSYVIEGYTRYPASARPKLKPRRHYRGYWCDYLLGNCGMWCNQRQGLLRRFCENHLGKWRIVNPISKPWNPQHNGKGVYPAA